MKRLSIISALLLVLPSIVLPVDCPVPDTGQIKCYNNNSEIACPLPGNDFYGQDATYALCSRNSYTKLDDIGNELPRNATEWVMVRDNVTGLVWEVKTDDGSIHDKNNFYNRYDADGFAATLRTQNFGGYSDWQVPTKEQLFTLVDNSVPAPGPAINTFYFPNTVSSQYLSRTRLMYPNYPDYDWGFDFEDGSSCTCWYSYSYRVRAVRGGYGSFGAFVNNGDGTVTDNSTGLMWEVKTDDGGARDKDNQYNWQEALAYCENLTLANYNDWRLPDKNELQTILAHYRYDPSIDVTFFPNTVSDTYWSSTTYADSAIYAWYVHFNVGSVYYGEYFDDSKTDNFYVRAVRGGNRNGSWMTAPTIDAGVDIPFVSGSDTLAILNFTSEALDNVSICVCPGEIPPDIPEGSDWVHRYYDIVPEPPDSSFETDLTLFYDQEEFELSGLSDESQLLLYRYDDAELMWEFQSGALNTTENFIRDSGVTEFSVWAFTTVQNVVGVQDDEALTPMCALFQNHPNPFNPTTTISFTLPKREKAGLSVYDVQGKLVTTLVDETLEAGFKEVIWDGKDSRGNQVSTGVYFYRLTAGNRMLTKKMVLLK
ncbi:MAG: DUF1566 domain-containing protein [Candidatus Latescibacterota bacterium]|nr:MAG: DUF1566 domain-containing protein [Candidatus Latescibacterota bacterium]